MPHPAPTTRRLLSVALATGLLACAAPALAQQVKVKTAPAEAPTPPAKTPEQLLLEAKAQGLEGKEAWREALDLWQQLFQSTADPEAAAHLALCYERLDEPSLAAAMLQLAIASPLTPEPRRAALQQRLDAANLRVQAYAQARALQSDGRLDDAHAAWTALYDQHRGATALAAIARLHHAQGRHQEAADTWRRLLDQHPLTHEAEADARARLQEAQDALAAAAPPTPPPAEEPPVSLEGDVRLIPLPETPAHPRDTGWTATKITGFSLLGFGIAGALSGIGIDVYAQGKIDEYTDAIAAGETPQQLDARQEDISDLQDAVVFTYLGGFVSAGVGAVLLFIAYSDCPAPVKDTPPPEDKTAGPRLDVGLGTVHFTMPF